MFDKILVVAFIGFSIGFITIDHYLVERSLSVRQEIITHNLHPIWPLMEEKSNHE
jgi:hypothetical protein